MSKCGACTMCCTVLAVPEINKLENVRCKYLTEKGCGIYETRPLACKQFECLWLSTRLDPVPPITMPAATRPDRSKVIAIVVLNKVVLHAEPSSPDAFDKEPMKSLIDKWSKKGIGILAKCGNKHFKYIKKES